MTRILSMVFLSAALGRAGAQAAVQGEPPCRLEFKRIALDRRGESQELSLQAATTLPKDAVVDVAIWTMVERYDRTAKAIVREPLNPPVSRKLRTEAAGPGSSRLSLQEPFPREGQIVIEVAFLPDFLSGPERESVEKALGNRFVPMKWEKGARLGTAASRLGSMGPRFDALGQRVAEAEKLVKKMHAANGGRMDAMAQACGEVGGLRTRLERERAASPCTAGAGRLWEVMGEVGTWGYAKIRAHSGKGGPAANFVPDGGVDSDVDAPVPPSSNAARYLKALAHVREVVAREYALAGLGEIAAAHQEAAQMLKQGWPESKARAALRQSLEEAKAAAEKHHKAGLARIKDPYARLSEGASGEALESAFRGLDRLAALMQGAQPSDAELAAVAAEAEKGLAQIEALEAAWRRLDPPPVE